MKTKDQIGLNKPDTNQKGRLNGRDFQTLGSPKGILPSGGSLIEKGNTKPVSNLVLQDSPRMHGGKSDAELSNKIAHICSPSIQMGIFSMVRSLEQSKKRGKSNQRRKIPSVKDVCLR